MTLYVAIIGLGTLAGILFNVLINKRLIFKILGIIITVITGTFACCVVLFPYYFFNSYNNLIIKLSLTAVLLIVIYISARMIVNACSSIKNKDKMEASKEMRKAEPAANEITVPDHALKNKVKSIISADKTPVRNLTQKVSVKLDDATPKAVSKEPKETVQAQRAIEPKTAYGGQPADKPSFGQIMKEADEKLSSGQSAQSSQHAAPQQKQEAAGPKADIEKKQPSKEAPVQKGAAVKQSLFEYEAEESGKPEEAAGKQKDEAVSGSKAGVQFEESVDITRDSVMLMIEKFSNTESKLDIQYEEEEAGEDKQAAEAAVLTAEKAESKPEAQAQISAEEAEAKAAAVTERPDGKQDDSANAKYLMIIAKAKELMEQEKYAYASDLLQVCSDRCEDTELKKQADISIIECFALSGRKSEAQGKWIELLNKKYKLDEADKDKLKQVMRSL